MTLAVCYPLLKNPKNKLLGKKFQQFFDCCRIKIEVLWNTRHVWTPVAFCKRIKEVHTLPELEIFCLIHGTANDWIYYDCSTTFVLLRMSRVYFVICQVLSPKSPHFVFIHMLYYPKHIEFICYVFIRFIDQQFRSQNHHVWYRCHWKFLSQ